MGDSDTENEQFCNNVMNELAAFQISKKPDPVKDDVTDDGDDDPDCPKLPDTLPPDILQEAKLSEARKSNHLNHGDNKGLPFTKQTQQSSCSRKDEDEKPTSEDSNQSESVKPPARILRLSRPHQPYLSVRSSQSDSRLSSSLPLSSSSTSSLSSSSSVTSDSAAASSSTASSTSGSRLAALQRPGSPMQRILQRAQSPALAASIARLSKAPTDKSSNTADKASTEAEEEPKEGEANGDSEAATNPLRQTLPARLSGSSITSSILSRRPQSPLTTGRQSLLLIHKQTSSNTPTENGGQPSPRSPLSDGQNSVDANISSSSDTAEEEKKAIRNKLRANSFRLKDLLTKRPAFSRSEDSNNATNGETVTSVKLTEPSKVSTADETKTEDDTNSSSTGTRARWRMESVGKTALHRSKSTVSERTNTLISARSLRTRSRVEPDNSEASDSKQLNGAIETSSNNSVPEKVSSSLSKQDTPTKNNLKDKDCLDKDSLGSVRESKISGATLLRSPRTRTQLPLSTVPSKDTSVPEADGIKTSQSYEQHPGINSEISDRLVQSVSGLEKEKEANLVFDSEKQSNGSDSSPEMKAESVIPHITKSLYGANKGSSESPVQKPHVASEPSTPMDVPPIRNSVSCENNLQEADFMHSSPALKRSLAVTDLDKAMRDRDQLKLNSLFKDSSVKTSDGTSQDSAASTLRSGGGSGQYGAMAPTQPSKGEMETDLDACRGNRYRSTPRSPRLQQRLTQSLDDKHSPPPTPTTSSAPVSVPQQTPPVHAVAPMVYKPNVNLEDAVKWPMDLPTKLDLRKMEVFEGMMLLNWLSGSIDKAHYLRLVMTKHDINVIISQMCTCLIAAGVMKQLESKTNEDIFKTDCMYYWTHTQVPSSHVALDVNKLQPVWPPTHEEIEHKPGLKYTEAERNSGDYILPASKVKEHQAAMVTMRHEYKEEVEKIQTENKGVLDRAREEYQQRLQQAFEKIALLQKEVEKYRCLAGIEEYSQNALSEANAAQLESGLLEDFSQNNGYTTPHPVGPGTNQYQKSSVTPDCVTGEIPYTLDQSTQELFTDLSTPLELQQDGRGYGEPGHEGVGHDCATIPAPPPPPPPPQAPPPPPPPPPPNMALPKKFLKPVVTPMSPMKPLFWQRIQVQELKTPKNKEYIDRSLVWEEIQEVQIDVQELDHLFSKSSSDHSRKLNLNKPKNKAKQPAKVISPKRSQTIGILLSSLRLEMSDIEYAILNFDTSQLSEEKLRQIYDCRGDQDEIKKLKDHIKKHPDVPLDKPDQFMYDLSLIPEYAERIFCFIFREAFQESISVIDTKTTNLKMTCQTLRSGTNIKKILGLVLGLGNYMNGGNKQRGQADGFNIDILPKLKDVKSKDNVVSLLQFLVQQYVKKYEGKDAGTERVKIPLPDHSDMHQASLVNFDELDKELKRIRKDFDAAQDRAKKVIEKSADIYLQPFKDTMLKFFQKGEEEFLEQEENLAEGKKIFEETVIFFCVKPPSGNKTVTPDFFFNLWSVFCQDFRDCWKKEQQRVVKQRIKDNENEVKRRQENLIAKKAAAGRVRTRKAGGLKDRLATKGVFESGPP